MEFAPEDLIDRFWKVKGNPKKRTVRILEAEIRSLCRLADQSFKAQSSLIEIEGPLKICGDIHGQFFDLLNLFEKGGRPPKTRYLFLGDYVDRGKNSLETICLLFALKVAYPKSVFMIRGNHESITMNDHYGFRKEIKRRFKDKDYQIIFERINRTFDFIPPAAVVCNRIFCCHGGISPGLTLEKIRGLRRPMTVPRTGWKSDLMWSDPDDEIDGWEKMNHPETNPKHRGRGYLFGKGALEEFLQTNKLNLLVRAHECEPKGYRWYFDKKLVTVFSAPNYCDKNPGAMLKVPKSGNATGFDLFN